MKDLIYGVGINDADYIVNQKNNPCPFYRAWFSMLYRCYNEEFKNKRKTYKGCFVCEEWLIFSNFKRWMDGQDWQGKQLDKDILFIGNKEYSPDKCVFVSALVNSLLTDAAAIRGNFPIGVTFHKQSGKFISRCSVNGKQKNLGLYVSPEDAHKAYIDCKRVIIKEVAKGQVDPRVKSALEKRAELI